MVRYPLISALGKLVFYVIFWSCHSKTPTFDVVAIEAPSRDISNNVLSRDNRRVS